MALLANPTDAETKRFTNWQANHISSVVHQDAAMYDRFGIHKPSEFDFFQTDTRWGYNGYLNQLCGILSPQHYFLSFQLLSSRQKNIDNTSTLLLLEIFFLTAEAQRAQRV
jgi:uncharacterized protein